MKLAVIIPAYEPDEKLIGVVKEEFKLGHKVIVVDDGSGVDYAEIFASIKNKSIILAHNENKGKGRAIKTALEYVKNNLPECEQISVMDADGQHLPEDMENLFLNSLTTQRQLILGVRSVGKEMPLRSRMGNTITRTVFRLASGIKVSDTQTGLRLFNSSLIDTFLSIEGERYEYETNVLMYCAKNDIDIAEVPIETIYHDNNNSCSHFNTVKDSFRIYKDILKFSLCSASSFLMDYLIFCLLAVVFPAGAAGLMTANILARVISGSYNYLANCKIVFHTGAKPKTAVQYLMLAIVILVLNSVFLALYTSFLHIPPYGAKVLTEITLFIISYVVQHKLIFKLKKSVA